MRLFCFPYAGGGAAIFQKWQLLIGSGIQVRPVELAGRGKRINEPHYLDFSELIEDVFGIIHKEIVSDGYAFFGHSLGAKIAYELALEIKRKGLPTPEHIFFSGRGAPHVLGKDDKEYHKLTDEEFMSEVRELGGTPNEFFESPELLKLFLPLLKNDFRMAERDVNGQAVIPVDCDISVFLGKDEEFTTEQIACWKKYTLRRCSIHYFNGGHFFINEQFEKIIEKIRNTIHVGYY